MGQRWPAAGSGALTAAVPAWDLLKEEVIIFITSTIVWPQVQQKVGTRASPLSNIAAMFNPENWIKGILSMIWTIKTRPSFPLSQSLPSGSFHKPLIFILQRADRMKATVTEN